VEKAVCSSNKTASANGDESNYNPSHKMATAATKPEPDQNDNDDDNNVSVATNDDATTKRRNDETTK